MKFPPLLAKSNTHELAAALNLFQKQALKMAPVAAHPCRGESLNYQSSPIKPILIPNSEPLRPIDQEFFIKQAISMTEI